MDADDCQEYPVLPAPCSLPISTPEELQSSTVLIPQTSHASSLACSRFTVDNLMKSEAALSSGNTGNSEAVVANDVQEDLSAECSNDFSSRSKKDVMQAHPADLVVRATSEVHAHRVDEHEDTCTMLQNSCGSRQVQGSIGLSPSPSLETNWSSQHILTKSNPKLQREANPSQDSDTQRTLLLPSPEKSIEQAVNAALCSLEKDMKHCGGEKTSSSAGSPKEAKIPDDTEEETHGKEESSAPEDATDVNSTDFSTSSVKRKETEFDPDNVQYIHKPLARTKKPYKPSKEKRNIKSYWFREFPWLVFDESKNLFFCSYCTAVKCDNIFTRGRPAIKPRKDSMVKHELTNPHKTAMSRLKIIPDVSKESDDMTENNEEDTSPSTYRQMKQFLHENIPDELDASTAHLLKFIPSQKSGPENRHLHERWFLEFTWFIYNHKQERFFCKLCREAGVKGVYTHGKSAANPKKGDLQVHERTSQHVAVLRKLGLPIPNKKFRHNAARASVLGVEGDAADEGDVDSIREIGVNLSTDCNLEENVDKSSNPATSASKEDSQEEEEMLKASSNSNKHVRRTIKSWWFLDFPWLEYNKEDECFYCKQCRKFNQPGVFCTGKKATVPKKDNFVKHENTESHHIALLQEAGLTKEEAVEQVTNGLGDESSQKMPLIVTDNLLDRDSDELGYSTRSCGPDICAPEGSVEHHPMILNQHLKPPLEQSQVQCVDLNGDNSNSYASQGDSALDILASMSVGDRVSENVATATNVDRRAPIYNVKMEWFVEFVWLELEEATLKMFCRYCKYFDPCGVFSVGKMATHARYEDIKKHSSSETHRRSMQMHAEQYPDTIQHIQENSNTCDSNSDHENATGVTPHHWSILFPWMQYDKATDTLLCRPCQQDGMSGSWISGIERSKISVSEIEQHEQLVSHRTAVVQYKRRHIATLATPTASLVPQQTSQTANSSEGLISGTRDIQRKRGRPRKLPSSSEGVDAPDKVSVNTSGYEDWKNAFWNMASKLRDLGILCDVTLSVGSSPGDIKMFQAHKLVLVCASEFFKACLRDNNFERYYHFSNISVQGMDGILSFIYGEHDKIDPENYRDVYEAASIFAIPLAKNFYKGLIKDQEKSLWIRRRRENLRNAGLGIDRKCDDQNKKRKEKDTKEQEEDLKNFTSDNETMKNIQETSGSNIESVSTEKPFTDLSSNLVKDAQVEKPSLRCHRTLDNSASGVSVYVDEASQNRKRLLTRTLPTCNVCGKRFLRIGFLRRHKERQHLRKRDKRLYKCDYCPKVCRTPKDIKLHRRRHTGERPFLCNQCGKAFTRRETLMEHGYVHKPDSDKPHKCTECGKGFFKLYDLQRHFTGIHSGLKPFQCHLCGKSFAWSRSLQDHLAGHVGKSRPFTCELCDMTFVRKYDLQRHQVKHEAKKPFRCNWCGRFFTQKSSMDKHQRDYCRNKPDKKTIIPIPANVEPSPQVTPQELHIYDQPVNLTAGVKDMSVASTDLAHNHAVSSNDLTGSGPQTMNPQQEMNTYETFQINPSVLPPNHISVYPAANNVSVPAPGELYHNQSMWMPGQTLEPTNAILFHHNQVSQ